MSETDNARGGVVNSLRLSDQEAEEILASMDRGDSTPSKKERRKQDRVLYEQRAGLIVKMQHPNGQIANYLVRVRNLSSGGVGFLHGSFVYSGTRCTVALRTRDNRAVCLEGSVVRCQHVRKHVHEVGLKFDKPIKLSEFVSSGVWVSAGVEASKELPQMAGLIMYVEDSISDQELLAFQLANIGVKVKAVSNVLAAIELANEVKFDAVLTNIWLPAMSGYELADFLRQNAFKGPIIAMTADDRTDMSKEAADHGCNAVLVKPYRFEELVALIEPHMGRAAPKSGAPVLMSKLWSDQRMQPLIRTFLSRLKGEIVEMERLVEAGNTGLGLRKLCMDVKGSAGGYGFPTISQAAQTVLEKLTEPLDVEKLKLAFVDLDNLSRSACALLDKEAAEAAAKLAEAVATQDVKAGAKGGEKPEAKSKDKPNTKAA